MLHSSTPDSLPSDSSVGDPPLLIDHDDYPATVDTDDDEDNGGPSSIRLDEFEMLEDDEDESTEHEISTSPLITFDAFKHSQHYFPQTSVMGKVLLQKAKNIRETPQDPRLYLNTNTPSSAVVCGVQGSGKSHTVSVILENCMLNKPKIGQLKKPMTGVVFHFDSASGQSAVSPCEAVYLSKLKDGQAGIPVTVLVSPSNLRSMTQVYSNLPVTVAPLRLSPRDITANRLLALMLCETTDRPLYMELILGMMRDMGEDFNFIAFRNQLIQIQWQPAQKQALTQRLAILDTYLKGATRENNVKNYFKPGHLVIIDLTDPMVDGVTSSGLFDIVLGLFMETPLHGGGRVVVLDEAHKYLQGKNGGSRLTMSIESLIRQQRHVATRTIISTQEPTVIPPSILDLVSSVIIHRFSSPSWASHLDNHISVTSPSDQDNTARESWFDQALSLRTGHALVFCPTTACRKYETLIREDGKKIKTWSIEPLGRGYLKVKIRSRISADGGKSVMAVANSRGKAIVPISNTQEDFRAAIEVASVMKANPSIIKPTAPVFEPQASSVKPTAFVFEPITSSVKPPTFVFEPKASIEKPSTFVFEPKTSVVKPKASVSEPSMNGNAKVTQSAGLKQTRLTSSPQAPKSTTTQKTSSATPAPVTSAPQQPIFRQSSLPVPKFKTLKPNSYSGLSEVGYDNAVAVAYYIYEQWMEQKYTINFSSIAIHCKEYTSGLGVDTSMSGWVRRLMTVVIVTGLVDYKVEHGITQAWITQKGIQLFKEGSSHESA